MKKNITYLVILVIVVGALFGLNYFLRPSMKEQIKNYLLDNGFNQSEYEDVLVKQESTTKKTSFSLGDYTYMLEVDETKSGMKTSLNATYDYKTEEIIYSYRVNYSDNINIWFKGEYKDDSFTCNKEFSSATISSSEQENICNLASVNVKIFELEAKTLFTKYKYVDYIKNR